MNHYDVLEVSHKASPEVLKAAYKSLMQRYHPDKNPGNKDAAAHARLITCAYDVLSNAAQRAAYDMAISQVRETPAATYAGGNRKTIAPANRATSLDANKNGTYRHFWLIILATIILFGGGTLYLLKKQAPKQALVAEPSVGLNAVESKPPTSQSEPAVDAYGQNPKFEDAANLTFRLASALIVTLKDFSASQDGSPSPPPKQRLFLTIPSILVQIGRSDSSEFIRYLDRNKVSINEKLEKRLAEANADELLKISGELYLRKFILDVIQEIPGTNRIDNDLAFATATPGRYGVTGISLPESFSLK
jgi:curved DNA-binding protein CbpA